MAQYSTVKPMLTKLHVIADAKVHIDQYNMYVCLHELSILRSCRFSLLRALPGFQMCTGSRLLIRAST